MGKSSGDPAASPARSPNRQCDRPTPPAHPAASHPLGTALTWLRWTIIVVMLLIVLTWPVPGRLGHPLWPLVGAFAGYNLLVELARRHLPRLHSFAWVPFLDLPVAGVLYFLDAEPGGPLFVAFFLAAVTAATCLSVRGAALYTAAVVAVIVAVAPTLPQWSPEAGQFRQLTARMVVLILVGVGTAVLTQRLARQEAVARSMRQETDRLEEVDRLRSEFVTSVSHDLRTPLTAGQAGLGFLSHSVADRLQPEERDLLANVRRNVDRLGALIDDLLTANQLEAGSLRLDREPFDLRMVVADAMSALHPLIREKGQTLEIDLPEPLPVEGDARQLEHAVVNVLANAHRHTPTGARIAIAGRRDAAEARLTVGDDGPGLPPGELERVFLRFYRRGPAGGSGLGLANARGIVELHGGRIRAASVAGRGATFTIALPLHEVANVPWR